MRTQIIKKFFSISISFFIFLCVVTSCKYNVEEKLYPKPVDTRDTTNATYSEKISVIIQFKCISCHNSVSFLGNVNLEGYNNVLTYATNRKLSGAINHTMGFYPMPKDSVKLSNCDIANVDAWINSGSPNN